MLLDSLNDIVTALGEKASGAVEATKLSVALSQQKRALAAAEQKIGAYYLTGYLEGEAADEAIVEAMEKGRVAREAIEDLTAQMAELEAVFNAPIVPGKKLCEVCGAYVENDAKYCSQCGAEFPAAEEMPEEQLEEEPQTAEEDMAEITEEEVEAEEIESAKE